MLIPLTADPLDASLTSTLPAALPLDGSGQAAAWSSLTFSIGFQPWPATFWPVFTDQTLPPTDSLLTDPLPAALASSLTTDPLPPPLGTDAILDPIGIRNTALSGDARIDGVLLGRAWNGTYLSYSFPDAAADYEYPYGAYNEPWSGYAYQASAQQRVIFQAVFEGTAGGSGSPVMRYGSFEAVSGLQFTNYGTATSDIRIAVTTYANPTAYAYYPADAGYGGDMWFGTNTAFVNPVLGDWGYFAHLHEAIHAMGLKGGHQAGPFGTPALPAQWDTVEFTVGTYRSFVGAAADGYRNETYGFPQTLMMLDIAALQYLYGANWGTNADATTYRWDSATGEMSVNGVGQGRPGANRVFLTIWDGGGTDTYDMSNYAGGVRIDLNPGGWSITSEAQRARLNVYDGDVLAQGTVYNALQYAADLRSLIEDAIGGGGADTILGNQAANRLIGNNGADSLVGAAGNDTLDGGIGTDSMQGGTGADLYYVESSLDRVVELIGGGVDRVISTISLNLAAEVENLTLAGTLAINANGNTLANAMTGNVAANSLAGGLGNDTLAGLGGNDTLNGGGGNDRLDGGIGNDTYVVDSADDVVTEAAGAGIDAVLASVSHTLAANVEALALTGTALIGIGNALNNTLTGNGYGNTLSGLLGNDSLAGLAGNDTLDGGGGNDTLDGGAGTDSMIGGVGNDVFIVNTTLDRVVELAGGGIDRAVSTVSLNLYAEVENLTLTGIAALNGNGNSLGNVMTGNSAANELNGGNGNDTLDGAGGSDMLLGGGGRDSLLGGVGDDTLVGGLRTDTLVGGDGADHFRFGAPNLGYDRIVDFTSGALEVDDVIEVSRAGFGNVLALGVLDPTQFSTNTASGAGAQFVYVAATGALRWDADGAGGTAAVTIAVLAGAPTLSAADIVVIA